MLHSLRRGPLQRNWSSTMRRQQTHVYAHTCTCACAVNSGTPTAWSQKSPICPCEWQIQRPGEKHVFSNAIPDSNHTGSGNLRPLEFCQPAQPRNGLSHLGSWLTQLSLKARWVKEQANFVTNGVAEPGDFVTNGVAEPCSKEMNVFRRELLHGLAPVEPTAESHKITVEYPVPHNAG